MARKNDRKSRRAESPRRTPPRRTRPRGVASVRSARSRRAATAVSEPDSYEQAEKHWRKHEDRFRAIFNQQFQFMAILSPEGVLLEVNDLAVRSTGVRREQILGKLFWETPWWSSLPEMREAWPCRLAKAARANGPVLSEDEFLTADGLRRTADAAVTAVKAPDGTVRFFIVQARDITEQKESERALRESEERLSLALEAGETGAWDWDMVRSEAKVSDSYRELFGVPPGKSFGYEDWLSALHPDDRERCQAYGEGFFTSQTATDWELEYRVITPHRGVRWHRAVGRVTRARDGTPMRFIGVSSDITERKLAEETLRESEERFRNMADHSPVIIWVTGPDGQCTYLNRIWYEFTGQKPGEGLGHGWLEPLHPDDREPAETIFLPAKARHESFHVEYRLRRRDGEWRWAMASAVPRFGSTGEFLGYIGSVVDIDDRKRLTEKLERTVQERTAALNETVAQLETFSYSIVHDMRAPLRSMRSFASLLEAEQGYKLDAEGRDYLSRITNSATRLDELITDVLAYSRVSMNQAVQHRVDLDKLVADLLQQYPQFQEAAALIQVKRPLPAVLGNSALLTQVLSNLLGNALKFVLPQREPKVFIRADEHDGRVRVWVEDNGIGIDPLHQEKIFGLFQRLHSPERFAGTGVGLAIVKKAVQRMGGTVGVDSTPDVGSRFWFELPAAAPSAVGAP